MKPPFWTEIQRLNQAKRPTAEYSAFAISPLRKPAAGYRGGLAPRHIPAHKNNALALINILRFECLCSGDLFDFLKD